jgi:hypothetical protein
VVAGGCVITRNNQKAMTSQTTDPLESWSPDASRQPEPLPSFVKFFLVQGVGFRCTAYRDPQGKWREAYSGDELLGDIRIFEP